MNLAARADFACRLCGGAELGLHYRQGQDGRFRCYKCRRCGLVNLDLKDGLDQEQYTDDLQDPTDDTVRQHNAIDASFAFISRHLDSPGRLLDIGCGNGRLLYVARRAGWDVKGLELSAAPAATVSQRLGVEVLAADFMKAGPLDAEVEQIRCRLPPARARAFAGLTAGDDKNSATSEASRAFAARDAQHRRARQKAETLAEQMRSAHQTLFGRLRELLSNLVYGVNDSSGFPADLSLIDTVDKLDAGDDVGELLEAA